MARTKKFLLKQDLSTIPVLINDTAPESLYFNIKQLSGVFSGGRNAFLISGTPLLKPSSEILIEMIDSNGNPLYVEAISKFIEAGARLVVVEVYEDTPPGPAMLTIVGTAVKNAITNTQFSTNDMANINVRWQKKIIIEPRNRNTTPIRIKRQPIVFVDELITTESVLSRTPKNLSANFTVNPLIVNKKQSGYIFKNNSVDKFASNQKEPKITGSLFLETREYLVDTNIPSSSYKIVAQYTSSVNLPLKLRNYDTAFAEQNIIDNNTDYILNITPLLSGTYNITSSTLQLSNTTYKQTVTLITSSVNYNYISESITITSESLSLAKLRIVNLDTVSGEIYRVKTSNKSANSQLEFEFVADTPTLVGEILVTGSTVINNREISVGEFNSDSIISASWYANIITGSSIPDTSYYTASTSLPFIKSNINILDGLQVQTTASNYFFGTRNAYEVFTNSEYTLKFTSYVTGSGVSSVDIYLIGSAVATKDVLGQKIGTVIANQSVAYFPDKNINFTVPRDGNVYLKFVVNSGNWQFSSVSLKVAEEHAFSPDEVTLIIPNNFKYDDLLEYKTEFFDINNNAIGLQSVSEPAEFVGARRYVRRTGDSMSGRLNATGGITVTGSTFISSGSEFYRWGNKLFNYGQWYSTTTQAATSANTAYSMSFDSESYNRGFTLGGTDNTRLIAKNDGLYNLQFSAQLENTANNTAIIDLWFKKNNTNISDSNTKVEITKQAATTGKAVAGWNFMQYLESGSYLQICWSSNQTTMVLRYETGSATLYPAIPSIIATITQVA